MERFVGCGCGRCENDARGIDWDLSIIKLPEVVSFVPSFSPQIRTASSYNRYISVARVDAISPPTVTVSLAVGATLVITSTYINSGTSTDVATATVDVTGGTATITGVAAGTTTVVLRDANEKTTATIVVTVA
jgi:hypothetical protein